MVHIGQFGYELESWGCALEVKASRQISQEKYCERQTCLPQKLFEHISM